MTPQDATPQELSSVRRFLTAAVILAICFSLPLYSVTVFSINSAFFSYILVVPFVSGYLAWIERSRFYPVGNLLPIGWAVSFWTLGVGLLLWAGLLLIDNAKPDQVDVLALAMYSLVLLLSGFACYFLGRQTLRHFIFPLAFLLFLAPFPAMVEVGLETMLQHGSSVVAQAFFEVTGMPVFRNGTLFQLPGFRMQVAPECSGLRSTMALFLTSLVAGQMFLRSPWKRTLLAVLVVPLALLRNGFRVFVIGELCVKISPDMINSWVHQHGGPLFFALSLIPFSLILYYLYKSEQPAGDATPSPRN
ncbi:MAG TPA: exosortase [Lacunisphaera sp.]|nr:exosortase [Lacunisphaera sp.]